MTDKPDFVQIAANFAANLEPKTGPDAHEVIDNDPVSDGAAAVRDMVVQEAVDEGVTGPVILPEDAVSDARGPMSDQAAEAGDETVSQGAVDIDIQPSHAETSIPEGAEAEVTADGASDSHGVSATTGDRDAAQPMRPEVAETGTDGGIFAGFPAAPRQPGEFTLPLCDLVIGKTSDGGTYDFDSGTAESLFHAVRTPENIAPIVVMKTGDAWHVIDGWARVMAFRFQFGDTPNFLVRVVEWDGTRNDALYNRFAAAFLTLKSRKIDKSILLRQFHFAWNVPQQILAARIGWIESRVTRELAAAQAFQEAPRFVDLHVKAGDPPIDYLYKVQQAREAAAKDDAAHPKRSPDKGAAAKLEGKLESLLARPERFGTADALARLGIAKPTKASASQDDGGTDAALPNEPLELIDCVEHPDGEPVAMIEMGRDRLPSIRLLVAAADLDDRRKAEVREVLRDAIDKLLGC